MTIKEFIEKAIEGEWKRQSKPILSERIGGEPAVLFEQDDGKVLAEVLLDPEAWEAVGKVELWCEGAPTMPNGECSDCSFHHSYDGWLSKMHRMIDALAEGKTIEQYLETL